MVQRCTDKNYHGYPGYGGRGIGIHPTWMEFTGFLADMGERPRGTSLDRIDNARGYEPGNCRWASDETQSRNRGDYNRLLTCGGETKPAAAWAAEYGMSQQALFRRLKAGWSVENAIKRPLDTRFLRRIA